MSSPSLMLAYRIAGVFGVSVEELCCLKENKEEGHSQAERRADADSNEIRASGYAAHGKKQHHDNGTANLCKLV